MHPLSLPNSQVQSAYAALSQLHRELLELQTSQAEFGAALEAVGTRGELLDVKRRLEGHQVGVWWVFGCLGGVWGWAWLRKHKHGSF